MATSANSNKRLYVLCSILGLVLVVQIFLPAIAVRYQQGVQGALKPEPFLVSVNPLTKTITESPEAEAALLKNRLSLSAAAIGSADVLSLLAGAVAASPVYRAIAAAGPARVVVIDSGFRKEQVAAAFGSALGWDNEARAAFLAGTSTTELAEGTYISGRYFVEPDTTIVDVQQMLQDKFSTMILDRYSVATHEVVPLKTALTIASMIERETNDNQEMRVISGIMWNRIFIGMPLQIDSTLQYIRGTSRNGWWPVPRPRDKYLKSPYNTYQNKGLPPGPIASPSVAAVIAALNPVKTECIFYFHDDDGGFHCSATYQGHVKALKAIYGRGR